MSNSNRCAACKSLRRRCPQDCVLAPYFPSNNPQRFACAHKIFGASNISKLLQRLPEDLRAKAADCMSDEARWRVQDPVYGCVGIISQLQDEITKVERELAQVRGEIAFHSTLRAQQQQMTRTQVLEGEASWFSETQNNLRQISEHQMTTSHVQQDEPSWLNASQSQDYLFPLGHLDFSHLHDRM